MIDFLKKQRGSSVLGLAFDGHQLEGIVLRRANGSVQVRQTFSAALALDPLHADPELVGREIRNHLDKAGIRERRCVVCLPLSWALILQIKIPNLPEADVDSFLQIEAERGFPAGHETLSIANSRFRTTSGEQFAMLAAISKNHLTQLERALKSAQLRPVSFSLGISALQGSETAQGVVTLVPGHSSVDLQVTCGGGVAALRTLDGIIETEGVQKQIHTDLLAREIRITLGQLPPTIREAVRKVRVFGRTELAQRLAHDLTPRAEAIGLQVERVERCSTEEWGKMLPPDLAVSPAVAVAVRRLAGVIAPFEFLPPKTNSWQQITRKISSKKLGWVGATAGSVGLLIALIFLIQQWQLSSLQSQWTAIEPKVKELDLQQQQIKKFRPWFDESFRSLTILRRLTEAFPEDGVVSARTLEIREPSAVICSGVARNNAALLKWLDQLNGIKEISNVNVQVHGQAPLQFTCNFQWEGGNNGN